MMELNPTGLGILAEVAEMLFKTVIIILIIGIILGIVLELYHYRKKKLENIKKATMKDWDKVIKENPEQR